MSSLVSMILWASLTLSSPPLLGKSSSMLLRVEMTKPRWLEVLAGATFSKCVSLSDKHTICKKCESTISVQNTSYLHCHGSELQRNLALAQCGFLRVCHPQVLVWLPSYLPSFLEQWIRKTDNTFLTEWQTQRQALKCHFLKNS